MLRETRGRRRGALSHKSDLGDLCVSVVLLRISVKNDSGGSRICDAEDVLRVYEDLFTG
jgi:hypothetical protein